MAAVNKPVNTTGIIGAQAAAIAPKKKSPSQMMRDIVGTDGAKALLADSLKENSGAFAASVIDLYGSDSYLQQCEPGKVFQEALKAVSLKLPINKQLGFAYIIPRRTKGVWTPVFQLGYKGLIQLCMRTGAYRHINAGAVYEGELVKQDKLTGEVDLSGEATSDKVVGYFAFIETLNGFRKTIYWSKEKLVAHAARYSDSYRNGASIWRDNFEEMAVKTVLRYLLSHWGIMSVEMETAMTADADERIMTGGEEQLQDEAQGTVEASFTEVDTETGEVTE